MEGKQWVDQVSKLLGKAKAQSIAAHGNLDALRVSIDAAFGEIQKIKNELAITPDKMPYPMRRKLLLSSITVRSKHYGQQDEVQLFVYQLGQETLQGLNNAELEGIHRWLERLIDGMETNVN